MAATSTRHIEPLLPAAVLPFNASEGEAHSDPRSLQIMDRGSMLRGAFFCVGDAPRRLRSRLERFLGGARPSPAMGESSS